MTIPNISVMITKSRTGLLTGYAKIIGSKDPGKENVMSRVARLHNEITNKFKAGMSLCCYFGA